MSRVNRARRASAPSDGRARDLAAIHMAKKRLGWSDDEYRDIMGTVCGGIRSAGELDFAGRKRFLAHLQKCEPATKPKPKLPPKQALCWSLWMRLADAGAVEQRTMHALEGYARRRTGVDSISWQNSQQLDMIIDSLKMWLKRVEQGAAKGAST